MAIGLSVSRVIAVSLSLTSPGAQFANFNSLLVMGQSDVIDTQTRIMSFSSLAGVAAVFGTTAPEYLAAQAYFSASPQPTQLYIGRWAQTATNGRMFGGTLSAAQQLLSVFTAVSSGGFKIQVDAAASPVNVASINLSGAANLNAVATLITTALTGASIGATCTWTGSNFVFKSTTTGAASKVKPLQAPTSGTDLSALLGCTAAFSGAYEVDGIAAETLLSAVNTLDSLSTYWFALNDDACTSAVDADRQAVAAYIEASSLPHMYGFTTAAAAALSTATSTDIGPVLQALGYQRTFIVYSSKSLYAACAAWGDLLTINLAGSNTMITLMFKPMVGIGPELLNANQAAALDSKGYNYYATYQNGVSIINNGWCVCSSPTANQIFIDEMFGALAWANQVQTAGFNALVAAKKLPQTDAGTHLLVNALEIACDAFVTNGYLAGGTWTGSGFGQLSTGDRLPKGYYIYQPPVSSQQPSDRVARKSVPIQIAGKTAGAIHSAAISMTVNP